MTNEKKLAKMEKDYKNGYTYKKLAKKYNFTYNQVTYFVKKFNWKRESNLSQALKKNKNAKGNKGGPGAEKGNTRALKTGEYETLYNDLLTEEEKYILDQFKLDNPKEQILAEIKTLTIRERRMLARIKKLQEGKKMNPVRIISSKSKGIEYKVNGRTTTTEVENVINTIQRLEEALTRIQEAKRRYIDSYHKMETDNKKLELDIIRLEIETAKDERLDDEDNTDDSFIKALENATENAWEDYKEDINEDDKE